MTLFDRQPSAADRRKEVLAGLLSEPKFVSAKYFYDQRGSELFEAITQQPEYYPTRTELSLLDQHLREIATAVGTGVCLVEYGSGSSQKIRKVLEHIRPSAYVPVDISRDHLEDTASELHADYPWLDILPTCADLTTSFALPEPVRDLPKVGFYPGSSIGNFQPEQAVAFLANAAATLGSGSHFLIGVDCKKATATLEAAYNDAAGVTAEFNRNLLTHIAGVLGVDIDPGRFSHRAIYNPQEGCIQMFLDVIKPCSINLGKQQITFAAGESIHTENSYKYDAAEFVCLVQRGGFTEVACWTDPNQLFSVFLLRAL